MQLVFPPLGGADEHIHYTSAYNLSNKMMNYEAESGIAIRNTDEEALFYCVPTLDGQGFSDVYRYIANANWFGLSEEELSISGKEMSTLSWYRYIFAAIGISFARLLKLGGVPVMFAGRIMNALLFIGLGYIAIRKLPVGKAQMLSLALVPMIIQLVSSYSYDAISISFSILFFALCLSYRENSKVLRWSDVLILIVAFVFLAQNKGVYATFIMFLFLIPRDKWNNLLRSTKRDKVQRNLMIIVAIVGIIIVYKYARVPLKEYYQVMLRDSSVAYVENDQEQMAWSIGYAMNHKVATIVLMLNTICKTTWKHILGCVGVFLGHWRTQCYIPQWEIVCIIGLLIGGLCVNRSNKLEKKCARWIVVVLLVTIALIYAGCMVRFTPVNSDIIYISSRYFMPVFIVGLISMGTDVEENNSILTIYILQNCMMAVVVYSALSHMLNL